MPTLDYLPAGTDRNYLDARKPENIPPDDTAGLDALIVRKIDSTLLTTVGDMIYRPAVTNYATPGNGASASGGGNNGSPANVLDGNDATFFGTFNFQPSDMVIDLGQLRAIGGFRVKLIGGSSTGCTAYSGTTSTGPWTSQKSQSKDGANVAQADFDAVIDSRYWKFIANGHDGYEVDWYTIELQAASVPARLPTTATGRGILNATQGAAIANATDAASTMARLNDLLAFLRTRGDIA